METLNVTGDFKNIESFLSRMKKKTMYQNLRKYGEMGVASLAKYTPKDTGKTADSWSYEIKEDANGNVTITWLNSNLAKGWAPVAILLQYGHATRNGGYVQGIDYINPAMREVFQQIADDAWREITK